jgi:predicted transcriptional regulator
MKTYSLYLADDPENRVDSLSEALDSSAADPMHEAISVHVFEDNALSRIVYGAYIPNERGYYYPKAFATRAAAETAIWLGQGSYEETNGIWQPYKNRVSELETFVKQNFLFSE